MLKVVFDTNTFVSAFLQPRGIPSRLFEMAAVSLEKQFEIYISNQIIDEIKKVLNYPRIKNKYKVTDNRIMFFIGFVTEICLNIGYASELFIVPDDPDDSHIVSAAIACNADFLISGDMHILSLKKAGKVKIVTVREFYETVKEK
jgi:uncharacterized protein